MMLGKGFWQGFGDKIDEFPTFSTFGVKPAIFEHISRVVEVVVGVVESKEVADGVDEEKTVVFDEIRQ